VAVLSVVTLSIYAFYLIFQWSKDLNALAGRMKYRPRLMLALSVVTLGLAGSVLECVYAYEIGSQSKRRGFSTSTPSLTAVIVALNSLALVGAFSSDLRIIALATILALTATVLIQREMNALSARLQGVAMPLGGGPRMRVDETPPWLHDVQLLRRWFYVYLALWLPGAALFLSALSANSSTWVGLKILEGSVFAYVATVVYAYRVMRDLHAANLALDRPWTVVVVALILTPFLLGFVVPLWVLRDARRAMRAIETNARIAGDLDPSPKTT
jgi:hypothetical protein